LLQVQAASNQSRDYGKDFAMRREPQPGETETPIFNAIWNVVKNWEIQTKTGSWYSATGNDVCAIIDAIADLRPADKRDEGRESGWLIERDGLCFGFCEHKPKWVAFTNDQAMRFARRSDAIRFIEAFRWQMKLENVRVTEHLWTGGAMKVRGDIESVNLATGRKYRRVVGEGESRLEIEDAINPVVAPDLRPADREDEGRLSAWTDEWLAILAERAPQIAYDSTYKRQFVDSVIEHILQPWRERAERESRIAVLLRNRCEELKPGSSSDIDSGDALRVPKLQPQDEIGDRDVGFMPVGEPAQPETLEAQGELKNFVFWAKRLLDESDNGTPQDCGDHCRNSCRWCGLRSTVERVEALLIKAQPETGAVRELPEKVTLADGKYTFYMKNGSLYCDRYGEAWRDFVGDKAVCCLFEEVRAALSREEKP
jgi:hypothetical protein